MSSALSTTIHSKHSISARLAAEAVGSFFLVLIVIAVSILNRGIAQVSPLLGLVYTFTFIAAFIGFGWVSGGHFNPAITAGVAVAGRITPREALLYVAAQLGGAIVAVGILILALMGIPNVDNVLEVIATTSNGFGDGSAI